MTALPLIMGAGENGGLAAIDEAHLQRMTLGDRRLEREVLELFLRQTTIMLDRIINADTPLAAASAHTLKGSALGIGAWRVARAAEFLELAAGDDCGQGADRGKSGGDLTDAVEELKAASLEAGAAIAARLTSLLAEFSRQR